MQRTGASATRFSNSALGVPFVPPAACTATNVACLSKFCFVGLVGWVGGDVPGERERVWSERVPAE